jgi:DNA polymerase III epsilon subunit-like protein
MSLRIEEIYKRLYETIPSLGNLGIVDLETTGFQKDARIIEIGSIAIEFDGFDINIKTFSELINPGFPVSDKITEITGITNEELSKARGDEVYQDYHRFLKQTAPSKLIAHNAVFDKGKLEYNMFRVGYTEILPPFECTMRLSKQHLKQAKADNLKTLSEHFNFKNMDAHRALADAETCAYIYAKIMLGEYE